MEALALHFASEKLDAVVVGSDQVWRWGMMGYNYFLDFVDAKTTRKYAYAASFGLSHWTDNGLSTAQVARLLADFSDISVRERSGVTLCKRIFGVEATQVIDPTLLYDADFYEKRLLKDFPRKKGIQVVSCILGEENREQCKKISRWADEHGLPYIELYHTSCTFPDLIQSEVRCLHLSVQEWLEHIRSAEYVVTNSFHCTVFSILSERNSWCSTIIAEARIASVPCWMPCSWVIGFCRRCRVSTFYARNSIRGLIIRLSRSACGYAERTRWHF